MLVFSDVKQGLTTIPFRNSIRPLVAAFYAAIQDPLFARLILIPNRLHHAITSREPIARVNVDMFAPEALRTMVRVAIAPHFITTMLTDKILFCANEHG